MVTHFSAVMISITSTLLLVLSFVIINDMSSSSKETTEDATVYSATKMPELNYYDKYEELKSDGKTAVVYPIITQSAYNWKGIHDYYAGYCDSCLSSKLNTVYEKTFSASGNGFRILEFLGYEVIDDIDIDKNPQILTNYNKIVLLHNEFVTKKEYKAIVNHPNVVYLYPGALSSEVSIDYSANMITLVRGPNYPTSDIINGFDWKYDDSQFFNDWNCDSWDFYAIDNGQMLNCYPETFLPANGYELLKKLHSL